MVVNMSKKNMILISNSVIIILMLMCFVFFYLDSKKETKVEFIQVRGELDSFCPGGGLCELLPTEPMLFDEVEKFIVDKEVISIDYTIDRKDKLHVERIATIVYRE